MEPGSHIRPWKQQLVAGFRPLQDTWTAEVERSAVIYAWEEALIAGMFQTADYSRHVISRYAEFHNSARDTEEAVQARLKRHDLLHQPGRKFRIIMWEAALHARICPPSVLAAQLDHLVGVIGLETVELGIVPFRAPLKIATANGFWVMDDRLAMVEDWHAELRLDDVDSIATYMKAWNTLRESAVFGDEALNVINAVLRSIQTSPERVGPYPAQQGGERG
ncbi:transcriptional regulator [Streptomyces piniterrae]|uniref:Transcriptional regulator n=1 Tax=Streptomyces piniterrae TaxID=2571125 RepID=A0A4U0NGZ6_9ACTN|nr:DUF5753 domain-containing protein [Streptomyces piniterrae]TJZ52912.1 transcriptional regulator [Streptomyces piniterrae]